jgi:hypothetical protein
MNDEAKKIIAFLLKRSGKKSLPESEFYLTMSMDLQWCSPKTAKQFVSQAIENRLLLKKDDELSASFDSKNVEIPTGFHPDESSFVIDSEEKISSDEDIVSSIIRAISEKSNMSPEDIQKLINNESKIKMLDERIAALLVAKRYQVNIDQFLPIIRKEFAIGNKG